MTSTVPTEGILYVSARLKSPPIVTPEIFRQWYDDEHIPQMCNAKDGVSVAARYKHTSPNANIVGGEATSEVPYPFVTLYKLNDIHWLAGDGFNSVPQTSDLLPEEVGRMAFGCFEGQLRSYKHIARSSVQPSTDRPKFVVTFEVPTASQEEFSKTTQIHGAIGGYRGSILYEVVPGLLEHEQKDLVDKGLVVTWFDQLPKLEGREQIWEMVYQDGDQDAAF